MIQLFITKATKDLKSNQDYQMVDSDIQSFPSLDLVKEYLQQAYAKSIKQPAYSGGEGEHGEAPIKIGWIFNFVNGEKMQQDRVEIFNISRMKVIEF